MSISVRMVYISTYDRKVLPRTFLNGSFNERHIHYHHSPRCGLCSVLSFHYMPLFANSVSTLLASIFYHTFSCLAFELSMTHFKSLSALINVD